jgi:hypothetical protein
MDVVSSCNGNHYQLGLKEWMMVIVLALGIAGWAMTSRLDANGQFLHDKLGAKHVFLMF